MIESLIRMIASIAIATLFCAMTEKAVGAMQQSGYKNATFLRWLKRKDNMFYNRLSVLALCLVLSSAITALCFSFLGEKLALTLSAVVFAGITVFYLVAEHKYALKVPAKATGRYCRLYGVYFLFTACFSYAFLALLYFLSVWNGSSLYALIAYVPFAITPTILPFLLVLANAVTGVFENARNRKFIKKAEQVLNERDMIRVGVVGSYGKTSVKNILATLLAEKYSVVATPESYNTPMGVAKTVLQMQESPKVFIAEMGARKKGDIAELCQMVKPDFAVFTGVCPQHIASFGTIESVFAEKSEILKSGAVTVCGAGLKKWLTPDSGAIFVDENQVKDLDMQATQTSFTLVLDGEELRVSTKLLSQAAVENICLAATLCKKMGMTGEEIARGIAKLQPVPHRLQLIENGGVYILDDGYNANSKGAKEAIQALTRFTGRKCIVTPGLVECGVLEEDLNSELGKEIASAQIDKVVLVGETLVGAVKRGYLSAGGKEENVVQVKTLQLAQEVLRNWLGQGDCVLFLNDLPDVY